MVAAAFAVMIPMNLMAQEHNTPEATPAPKETQENDGTMSAQELAIQVPVRLKYLLHLPKDYGSKDKWPMMLFLHGSGERGDVLEAVKVHGPPKLIGEGEDFPFIVVSPQSPAGRWWQPVELEALLDDLAKTYKVDEDRVYCTGLSMGGFGTWSLAFDAPPIGLLRWLPFAAVARSTGQSKLLIFRCGLFMEQKTLACHWLARRTWWMRSTKRAAPQS